MDKNFRLLVSLLYSSLIVQSPILSPWLSDPCYLSTPPTISIASNNLDWTSLWQRNSIIYQNDKNVQALSFYAVTSFLEMYAKRILQEKEKISTLWRWSIQLPTPKRNKSEIIIEKRLNYGIISMDYDVF